MKRPKIVRLWRTNIQWRRKLEGFPVIEIDLPSLNRLKK